MKSVYIAYGMICFVYWFCYYTCDRYQMQEYSRKKIVLNYIVARVFPMLVYGGRITANWLCLAMEWAIIAILVLYFSRISDKRFMQKILLGYLYCPAVFPLILFGNTTIMILVLMGVVLFCILYYWADQKQMDLSNLCNEYLLLSACVYGQIFLAYACEEALVVLQEVFRFGIVLSILLSIWKIKNGKCERNRMDDETLLTTTKQRRMESCERTKINKKDIILMMILTAAFAGIVFTRLGRTDMPESFIQMQSDATDKDEIILDFGKDTTVSKLRVFLGYKGRRTYDIYFKEGRSDRWELFNADFIIQSVYAWNDVPVDKKIKEIKLVLKEEDARILEIVCLDENGDRVMPANSQEYQKLFDEQELYPKTATYYDETMFDEVYHARTAYEFLHGLSIYENTHPPLGKSLISIGIAIFGMNPFGFRCVCALAGVLMIPLMYLWAHAMFGKTKYAVFETILIETLFMNVTLSRIATLDILVALFVMGMFATMYSYGKCLEYGGNFKIQAAWLLSSGIFMALAVATKWTGVYAAFGIAILFFISLGEYINGWNQWKQHVPFLLKTGIWCVICFLVIPGVVYVLSYIPFTRVYTDKNLIQTAISNAQLMLGYHSKTVFEHPYASEWYEWLIDKRPLLDSFTELSEGKISTIATFFNPLICIGGLIALLHQIYLVKKERDKNAGYLVISYLSVLIPWLMIYRTVFIYQYFLGGLLLPAMITNSLKHTKRENKYMICSAVTSILLFIMFYPVLTGADTSADYVNMVLEWVQTWSFAI